MVLVLAAVMSSIPKTIEVRRKIWTCLGFGMLCFIAHRLMVQGHTSACTFSVFILLIVEPLSQFRLYSPPTVIFHLYRNTCNGPNVYVDDLTKDGNHSRLEQLWICYCFEEAWHSGEIELYTNATIAKFWRGKHLNLNMEWVSCSDSQLVTVLFF